MRWVEIAIEAGESSVDAVTNIMMEEGCGGTAVSCPSSSVSSGESRVMGYLPVDDRLEGRLGNIKTRVRQLPGFGIELASDEIGIKWVEDDEWLTAWKKFFTPVRTGRIVVKPSWEEYEAEPGDILVEIDPGMAFGTGHHPTTQLCLNALQDFVKGGETVLDMGTGSGILAMAAVKLGAAKVVGLDIDSVAVEVAQANVRESGLSDSITIDRAGSPDAFEGTADIVLANIVANVIIELAEGLRDKVKPGGKLIASGIILERVGEVHEKLEGAGLVTLEERHDGEWAALIMENGNA